MFLSLETLTSIIRTGLPVLVELIDLVNSDDLTQMVNFPTRISDCDSHSLALLDLFLTSDASICSAMAFPPLENSDNIVVSVSIDSPLTVASSVQVAILQITLSKKSLMYSRKSVGPRIEP